MGRSTEAFIKYPRTPHLFCEHSKMASDDKGLKESESLAFLHQQHVVLEEKLDGTNVGISTLKNPDGSFRLFLQCRGHEITSGMHPQYDLFKSWAYSRQEDFFDILSDQYVLYGEWVYAVHTRRYTRLPHYFHEFDIWDKKRNLFLDTPKRQEITQLLGLVSVPILYEGTIPSPALGFLQSFLGKPSCYGDEPLEGLYGKIEAHGETLGRFKFIDPLFTQTVLDSDEHWIHRKMEVQGLAQGVDLYGT